MTYATGFHRPGQGRWAGRREALAHERHLIAGFGTAQVHFEGLEHIAVMLVLEGSLLALQVSLAWEGPPCAVCFAQVTACFPSVSFEHSSERLDVHSMIDDDSDATFGTLKAVVAHLDEGRRAAATWQRIQALLQAPSHNSGNGSGSAPPTVCIPASAPQLAPHREQRR